ncbi:MAG: PilN domain-containing protein [Bryobacteraceae bacterium]|jgi:Tfp pilus assembly protein PilN
MKLDLPELRKWLAIGAGVGIQIGEADLTVVITRVRPTGTRVLGATTIARFRERPAAEWGAEYNEFLKRLGGSYLSATVLLPRRDLIVRQLALPGVADRDLAAAIQFQLDSLHPYGEDEAAHAWCRIGRSGAVLIVIVRREVLERYVALFSEAGIRTAGFTFSAAAVYSGVRLLSTPPRGGFLALSEGESGLEIYGESEAKPIFSAAFELPRDNASALASAELRLAPETEPLELSALLPAPHAAPTGYDSSRNTLVYAAALAGACPRLALPLNLLPPEHRTSTSRAMFVPSVVLAFLLALVLVALVSITPVEDRKYLAALGSEIARLEPRARKAGALDRAIDQLRARASLLDSVRQRSKADLDALAELTRLLQPPVWVHSLEMNRNSAVLNGQAEQAAPLLKLIDGSPLFQGSEFTVPLSRAGKNEIFRIRTLREGVTR